jgi:N-carbamoylputrescine amidase
MRVAALGLDCSDPPRTWQLLEALPPVDLLVLPELCLIPWLCASESVDVRVWDRWAASQDLDRLLALPARVVIGTMAVAGPEGRFNDAFCVSDGRLRAVHRKTYLPDEPGFWEASWYSRGPVDFRAFDTPVGRIGVSVCTEMWFTQHKYPDVDFLVVPRATPAQTTAKWLAGGAAHAVCSGAFCVSSNRAEDLAAASMGATGWIIDPEGATVAVTDAEDQVAIADVDPAAARSAKRTYPRYVRR